MYLLHDATDRFLGRFASRPQAEQARYQLALQTPELEPLAITLEDASTLHLERLSALPLVFDLFLEENQQYSRLPLGRLYRRMDGEWLLQPHPTNDLPVRAFADLLHWCTRKDASFWECQQVKAG